MLVPQLLRRHDDGGVKREVGWENKVMRLRDVVSVYSQAMAAATYLNQVELRSLRVSEMSYIHLHLLLIASIYLILLINSWLRYTK